ncbi:phosphoenolpyruvate--protein phosphotransferase [Streptomyces nigrescens]|uniref:phosphoenolpyruvate--protein phosphotransferase n=1 Tax=Streptomyces nigrescens TaxID=1920 RepID=UPI0036F73552
MATAPTQATVTSLTGIAASPGITTGTAILWDCSGTPVTERAITVDGTAGELRRLDGCLEQATEELAALGARCSTREEKEIIAAQRAMLADPDLRAQLVAAVSEALVDAAGAVQRVLGAQAAELRRSESARIAERGTDIDDLRLRLLAALGVARRQQAVLPEDAVVVAADLTPSQTIGLDRNRLRAFVLSGGGPTAHTTILARSLGIPAVVQVAGLEAVRAGATLVVDGDQGTVITEPTSDEVARAREAAQERARAEATEPLPGAATGDGHTVRLSANIGSAHEAARAHHSGARSVGLFRSEFVFLAGEQLPGEEEQLAAYAGAVEALGGGRVTIRLLDVGGDKPLPPLTQVEANPMLGHRGVRLLLSERTVLHTQLRAILRAAAHGEVWICVPMVSSVAELCDVREELNRVRAELQTEGRAYGEARLGVMIETPAAVLAATALAEEADFFSIGTNDLLQYLVAADRDNARVNALLTPFHPALLRAIGMTVEAAHAHGITVSVCGESAADPRMQQLLVGLGVDELSMTAARLPDAAQSLAALSGARVTDLARRAVAAHDADAVQRLLEEAAPAAADEIAVEPLGDDGFAATGVVRDPEGLHARPASLFVQTAQGFRSEISVYTDSGQANAKAMLSVLALGVDGGATVRIEARGMDAREAVLALSRQLADPQ